MSYKTILLSNFSNRILGTRMISGNISDLHSTTKQYRNLVNDIHFTTERYRNLVTNNDSVEQVPLHNEPPQGNIFAWWSYCAHGRHWLRKLDLRTCWALLAVAWCKDPDIRIPRISRCHNIIFRHLYTAWQTMFCNMLQTTIMRTVIPDVPCFWWKSNCQRTYCSPQKFTATSCRITTAYVEIRKCIHAFSFKTY